MLELYKKLWSEIKKKIKSINSGESIKYKNHFMKIILDSCDDLPLNKIFCFSVLNVLCESVFQTENENYSQIHTNKCELSVVINFYGVKSQAFLYISYIK